MSVGSSVEKLEIKRSWEDTVDIDYYWGGYDTEDVCCDEALDRFNLLEHATLCSLTKLRMFDHKFQQPASSQKRPKQSQTPPQNAPKYNVFRLHNNFPTPGFRIIHPSHRPPQPSPYSKYLLTGSTSLLPGPPAPGNPTTALPTTPSILYDWDFRLQSRWIRRECWECDARVILAFWDWDSRRRGGRDRLVRVVLLGV